MPDEPSAVAVHEAGHAVVALLEGLWFLDVVMPGTLSGDPSTRNLNGGIEMVKTDPRWTLEADIRVSVAGPLAERRVARAADYDARFEAHVGVYRSQLRRAGHDAAHAIVDAVSLVDTTLHESDVWEAIQFVAHELDHTSRLPALEVRRLLLGSLGNDSSYPVADGPPPPPGGRIDRPSVFEQHRIE